MKNENYSAWNMFDQKILERLEISPTKHSQRVRFEKRVRVENVTGDIWYSADRIDAADGGLLLIHKRL